MKSSVYNTYFRKHRRNKHASATKPLSFFNLILLLFPQTQLNQLHLSGNALEAKKKKMIDYHGGELHFKSTEEILFPTHTFHHLLAISGRVLSRQEEMRRPWDRFRFKKDLTLTLHPEK